MATDLLNVAPDTPARQRENRGDTGLDTCAVMEKIIEYSNTWDRSTQIRYALLRSLCRLVKDEGSEEGFTALQIYEAMASSNETSWSTDRAQDDQYVRTQVRKYFNELKRDWEDRITGVRQTLDKNNLNVSVELDKKESRGGAGNNSLYLLRVMENSGETIQKKIKAPYEGIEYICEETRETRSVLARMLTRGFQVSGWRLILILLCVCCVCAVGALTILATLYGIRLSPSSSYSLYLLITGAVVCGSLYASFKPLFYLPDNRIDKAPWWLQPFDGSRLLEWQAPPLHEVKAIRAVKYSSVCPFCDGKVVAQKAGFEFHRRIIGKCMNAPKEHVFSFDHVSRSGKFLRV